MFRFVLTAFLFLQTCIAQEDLDALSSVERTGRHASHSAPLPKKPLEVYLRDEVATRVEVPENLDILVFCRFRNFKKPYQVTWKRKDNAHLTVGGYKQPEFTGEFLRLTNITRRDTGSYMCIASDGQNPSRSRYLDLNIFYKPTVMVPQPLIKAELGNSVVLSCTVESFPVVKGVTWAAPPIAPDLEEPELFSHDENWGSVVESRLTLGPLGPDHYGVYMCQANNPYGTSYSTVTLAQGSDSQDSSQSVELAEYVKKDSPTTAPKDHSVRNAGTILLVTTALAGLLAIF